MNGEFVVNPPNNKLKDSSLNLTIAGTEDAIVMVEAGANEIPENVMVDALNFGHCVGEVVEGQLHFRQRVNTNGVHVGL